MTGEHSRSASWLAGICSERRGSLSLLVAERLWAASLAFNPCVLREQSRALTDILTPPGSCRGPASTRLRGDSEHLGNRRRAAPSKPGLCTPSPVRNQWGGPGPLAPPKHTGSADRAASQDLHASFQKQNSPSREGASVPENPVGVSSRRAKRHRYAGTSNRNNRPHKLPWPPVETVTLAVFKGQHEAGVQGLSATCWSRVSHPSAIRAHTHTHQLGDPALGTVWVPVP